MIFGPVSESGRPALAKSNLSSAIMMMANQPRTSTHSVGGAIVEENLNRTFALKF